MLPSELKLYYYRTHQGAESDLVLVKGTEPKVCIEIKYTSQPKLSKGFRIAVDDLKTETNFIITPKSDTYPISKSTYVCNLIDFLSKQLNRFQF
jgi:predicted AAA+ superfamily ATPase